MSSLRARDDRYSLRHVQASLGLSRAVVASLIDAGFVTPTRGLRNEHRFSFQDLMLLRTAHDLREADVAPREIVAALARLRAGLPQGSALTSLRIGALGARVVVRDRDGSREAASGQFVMDFDAASAAASHAVSDASPHDPPAAMALAAPPPSRSREPAATPASASVVTPLARARPAPASPAAQPLTSRATDARDSFAAGTTLETRAGDDAERAYRRALELDPKYLDAAINLSALLCDRGEHEGAIAVCEAMFNRGVDHALLRFNHALALDDLRQPRAALASYRRAITLDPEFADAHYNAACLLETLNDARGALRHFNAYRRLQNV